jgi:hypothetical protein
MGARLDSHPTRQSCASRNVHVVANHAIVLDNCTGIDDDILAHGGVRAQDRAGHDSGTGTQ